MEEITRFLSVSSGSGDGSGDGYGSGITSFAGRDVFYIDGIATLLYRVHGNLARGAILKSNLTIFPCWVAKVGGKFGHGGTAHKAVEAARAKLFEDMPEAARISAFVEAHKAGQQYPHTDYYVWHNRLTGSCEMGRRAFARDHGLSVDEGSMTPEDFVRLTEHAYGGDVIRKLRPFYGMGDAP